MKIKWLKRKKVESVYPRMGICEFCKEERALYFDPEIGWGCSECLRKQLSKLIEGAFGIAAEHMTGRSTQAEGG